MYTFIKLLLSGFLILVAIDSVWIGIIARSYYDQAYSSFERILRPTPAAIVYILLLIGLIIFVLPKGENSPLKTFLYGALFGLIAYSIFDLTNYAVFSKWQLIPSIIDMIWGSFLMATMSLILFFLKKMF